MPLGPDGQVRALGPGESPPSDAPVSFFAPVGGPPQAQDGNGFGGPPVLGPDGQPIRKRRRRRRRGRGGRQREWRAGPGGPEGGGGPPPTDGGGGGGGGDGGPIEG